MAFQLHRYLKHHFGRFGTISRGMRDGENIEGNRGAEFWKVSRLLKVKFGHW